MEKAKGNSGGMALRLKMLRVENGYTQEDVARMLGVSQQMYSKYERSDTMLDSETLVKICDIYGVSADYVLGIDHTAAAQKSVLKSYTEEENIDRIVEKVISKIKNSN